ncbi:MAG: hypothetical protein ACE5ES_05685 [Candidatus Nanoarchaeia archaeon]
MIHILNKNLEKMLSAEKGGMLHLLEGESIGGNAGTIEINGNHYSCAGANFLYDDNGKISEFTNYGRGESELNKGTFRVAVDLEREKGNPFFKIVGLHPYYDSQRNRKAQEKLNQCIRFYNRLQEKRISKKEMSQNESKNRVIKSCGEIHNMHMGVVEC